MTDFQLLQQAIAARDNAYCPYSGYAVGAALQTSSGKIYTGCNVENASFSATLCAERSAIAAAVSAGEREFQAIAIAGGKGDALDSNTTPCGVCRQVLAEFCTPDFKVILGDCAHLQVYTMEQLLPAAFRLEEQ